MKERYESARSPEELVAAFAAQYAAHIRLLNQAGTQVDIPKILKGVAAADREERLMAVAAYGALPKSIGERKWLIAEAAKKSSLLSDDARAGIIGYENDALRVRLALILDWRDSIADELVACGINSSHDDALSSIQNRFSGEFASYLDRIMRYAKLPDTPKDASPLFAVVDEGEHASLITRKDADRLRLYLQEFIVGPKKK